MTDKERIELFENIKKKVEETREEIYYFDELGNTTTKENATNVIIKREENGKIYETYGTINKKKTSK